jgi:hypothetical protein
MTQVNAQLSMPFYAGESATSPLMPSDLCVLGTVPVAYMKVAHQMVNGETPSIPSTLDGLTLPNWDWTDYYQAALRSFRKPFWSAVRENTDNWNQYYYRNQKDLRMSVGLRRKDLMLHEVALIVSEWIRQLEAMLLADLYTVYKTGQSPLLS